MPISCFFLSNADNFGYVVIFPDIFQPVGFICLFALCVFYNF
ncbi:Uncharacterized protein dnm_093930 [Desulfonema magnum]|uniref:Uncharacterized protein n=1 Tax=Desulfonema magnum TaxID=45655 RepID=A0A975BXR0_9BACT|nr:Uncharacterized protein dnm_093930 [Desulfonema magnum]